MIRSILTGVVTSAIFWAPVAQSDEIGAGIAHAAKCMTLADAIGLTDQSAKWDAYGAAVVARSGLSDFDKGYWAGAGMATAVAMIMAAGEDRAKLFSIYSIDCLGGGQKS